MTAPTPPDARLQRFIGDWSGNEWLRNVDGEALAFQRDAAAWTLRHRYTFEGPDRLRFTAEIRKPGQAGFSTLVTADYHHERLGLHR